MDEIIKVLKSNYPDWMNSVSISKQLPIPINSASCKRRLRLLRRFKVVTFRLHEQKFPKMYLYQYKKPPQYEILSNKDRGTEEVIATNETQATDNQSRADESRLA